MESDNNNAPSSKPARKFRWFWNIFSLTLLLVIGYFFYANIIMNPCDIPIHYSIGNIDSRFKISSTEVNQVVEDAADRWNRTLGENIYTYDPNARLKINLVYDDRQQKLDNLKSQISQFDQTSQTINQFRSKVEKLSSQYETDLNAYNQKVAYWNAQGGAPTAVFNQLNTERASLDKRRIQINQMASLLNTQISENNGNISEFNDQIEKDSNKIITSGEYFTDGKKINIYTYGDEKELRLVLMHELGHAMSHQHDVQATSIMYPVLQDQNMDNPLPSEEDKAMVGKICGLDNQPLNLSTIISRIRLKFARLSTQQ